MGTTADKLNKVLATKTDIKNAIVEKGVEVSDLDTFATYGDKIRSISGGGGSAEIPEEFSPFYDVIDLAYKSGRSDILPYSWNLDVKGKKNYQDIIIEYWDYRSMFSQANLILYSFMNLKKDKLTYLNDMEWIGRYIFDYIEDRIFFDQLYEYYKKKSPDLNGKDGYWNFPNLRYAENFSIHTQYWDVLGFHDFTTLSTPLIYAPKLTYFYYNGGYQDYKYYKSRQFVCDNGLFYMPNGKPYELTPEIMDYADGSLHYDTRIFSISGGVKKINYSLYLNFENEADTQKVIDAFPINKTGYAAKCSLLFYKKWTGQNTGHEKITVTESQIATLSSKGWSVV